MSNKTSLHFISSLIFFSLLRNNYLKRTYKFKASFNRKTFYFNYKNFLFSNYLDGRYNYLNSFDLSYFNNSKLICYDAYNFSLYSTKYFKKLFNGIYSSRKKKLIYFRYHSVPGFLVFNCFKVIWEIFTNSFYPWSDYYIWYRYFYFNYTCFKSRRDLRYFIKTTFKILRYMGSIFYSRKNMHFSGLSSLHYMVFRFKGKYRSKRRSKSKLFSNRNVNMDLCTPISTLPYFLCYNKYTSITKFGVVSISLVFAYKTIL